MINNFLRYFLSQVTSIDDLLFMHKNKYYGAYLLRKSYPRNMSIGLGIAILIFLITLLVPAINWRKDIEDYTLTEVVLDTPPELSIPNIKSAPPKSNEDVSKVKQKEPTPIKTGEIPKFVKDDQKDDSRKKSADRIDSTKKESTTTPMSKDSTKGSGQLDGEEDIPFDFVDVLPQFPGGQRSLSRFISSKLVYPGSAIQNKIEGIVVVGFVIDKFGGLRNPKILKSLYPACDEEALRVVRLIPDWTPAKNQGRNVSINFKMPIEFKLIR